MRKASTDTTLSAETTVRQALELTRGAKARTWIVTNQVGVVGVISLSTLQLEMAKAHDSKLGEITDALNFPHVHADHGLDLALERMGTDHLDLLPVVGRADVHKLEGIVMLSDVLDSYGITRADT